MLGSINGKLDKNTCLVSLGIISFITIVFYSPTIFQLFDISGVFKQ